VIDSTQKFGNGFVFPAGPLRESIKAGLRKTDMVLVIGNTDSSIETLISSIAPSLPICHAQIEVLNQLNIPNNKVIGFCGIGQPKKFRNTLIDEGYDVIDFLSFADHHRYTITELQKLTRAAKCTEATLVTTSKDYVKIPEVFKTNISVLDVTLRTKDELFENLILQAIKSPVI
jgi:tetraacyldisaccharide 4'-kinase